MSDMKFEQEMDKWMFVKWYVVKCPICNYVIKRKDEYMKENCGNLKCPNCGMLLGDTCKDMKELMECMKEEMI